MNKKTLFFNILGFLSLPILASAQLVWGFDNANISIESLVENIKWAVWVIFACVVVISFVVAGIMFLTAQGDPTKLSSAKKALFAAVAGTVLVIVAQSAMWLVGNAFGIYQ